MSHFIDTQVVEGLHTHKSWNTNILITTVAAATQTLTAASETTQVYQGTVAGQIVKMPDATTFGQAGQRFQLHNDSTQNVTVQDSAATQLFLLGIGQRAFMVCTSIGTAAGVWSYILMAKSTSSEQFVCTTGSGLTVNFTGGNARFNGVTTVVAGGAVTCPASTSNGWIYVDVDGTVKATATLPNGAMPLYQFTTSGVAVTALIDVREVIDANTVWGVAGDIAPERYNTVAAAGVLEKAARADHTHAVNMPLYKAGSVAAGTFAGNPKTAAVVFTTAFPSTSYMVTVTGSDGRSWIVTGIATTGFTINSQANQVLTGPVYWEAKLIGESQ